ncbi:MAG: hypothetical protein PHU85_13940, partial [Phycisphaerae bacterium]|nr:hypothetical protein [Phycisphaerae bacterium]
MRTSLLLTLLPVCSLLCVGNALAAPSTAPDCAEADKVLAAASVKTGLCIDLGCGRADQPSLPAGLASRSEMLVHALAIDDAALGRARAAIEVHGVPGRAMAEKLPGKTLPYLPDLARLVVVEDPAALEAAGVTKDEMLRVLAPGGMLCVRDGAKWAASTKPRPKSMDEWTHPHHGPDGNLASADKAIVFPLD